MKNSQLNIKSKKLLFVALAVMLCAAIALAVIFGLKGSNYKTDDADVLQIISAYRNASNGYTKFPEDEKEAYFLVYEKLRNMPYERVYLDGVKSLVLNSVSSSLTDKQKNDLEKIANNAIQELNLSFERIFVDYGEDVKNYIPDISKISPEKTVNEIGENGEYIITLYLSKDDADMLVTADENDVLEKVKSEKLNNNITVNSAAASAKDGFIKVYFDVYNSYISKIVTAVNYNVNLGCEFSGRLKNIEQTNILFEICSLTEYATAREGIYFTEKAVNIAENDSFLLDYNLMVSSDLSPEDYTVWYESSKTDVVSVDDNGNIKGLKKNVEPVEVKIYLRINGGNSYHDTCTVSVDVPVKNIEIDRNELMLKAAETAELSAKVSPANAGNKDVVWLSADEAVVKVSEDGVLTAVGIGQTKIIALSLDDGCYDTCTVTVEN